MKRFTYSREPGIPIVATWLSAVLALFILGSPTVTSAETTGPDQSFVTAVERVAENVGPVANQQTAIVWCRPSMVMLLLKI